ncbi:MAG: glycosyltransferase family 39 protein [Verrucomicrobiaceae bacterium]|nr:MAG: glycosyltransferase family 39 protein [Verrucomicrobiaceae bacterium]
MTLFSFFRRPKFHRVVAILLSTLITCRVLMMVAFPHTDSSEARYAEISRKMVETGDWLTPQFDYGVPFWAKPPLSMWMSALGMEFFGVNEFGSRIFIFLAAMGILLLVVRVVRSDSDATTGLLAAMFLMGMPLFFYCSAAVMTDLALALGTTLSMVAFRIMVREGSRVWGHLFFIGLAIGLLSKGPLALVITLPPVVGWMILTRSWRKVCLSLPWISGTLLMLVLSVPWYIAAEANTPGFLNYFIIGEHWKRFVIRGWQGDLYGNAHSEVPGTIWAYLLMVTFPWCLGFLAVPFRKWKSAKGWAMADEGRGLYWVLWALWPIVFFTPSRNIIATYPLPALPAIAILLAGLVTPRAGRPFNWKRFDPFHPAIVGTGIAAVLLATLGTLLTPQLAPKRTERELVQTFMDDCEDDDRLLYFGIRRYSAEFYSEGKAEHTDSPTVLVEKLEAPGRLFIATTPREFATLPPAVQRRFMQLTHWKDKRVNLYLERGDILPMTGIDPAQIYPIGS